MSDSSICQGLNVFIEIFEGMSSGVMIPSTEMVREGFLDVLRVFSDEEDGRGITICRDFLLIIHVLKETSEVSRGSVWSKVANTAP